MKIQRIDTYTDTRFSKKALYQHGCFLIDNFPYEIEIISDFEAIIRGKDEHLYIPLIEEFRFYTPHITKFYNICGKLIKKYPSPQVLNIPIEQIQPSQFYVDQDKIKAIHNFIHTPHDIIIQVMPYKDRYLSLDGHTRLYYALLNNWDTVRAIIAETDATALEFAQEAQNRNIYSLKDIISVSHKEYQEKWNHFCDEYFKNCDTK